MIITHAKVIENIELAKNIWKMTFISQDIADDYIGAGQFISILPNAHWAHPIMRPMSIADVKDDNIEIIYKLFGPITKQLSTIKSNDYVQISGPIGNTFTVDHEKYKPILIGGGIGLSPILNLSEYLNKKDILAHTIIGAKSSYEHFIEHNPNENIFLSTDDGSIGIKGTVIDALKEIIRDINNPYIFACGPDGMLSSLKIYLSKNDILGQFSVESYMACGFGFCQGCAISKDTGVGYHLVCKDGPVFDYNEVTFD